MTKLRRLTPAGMHSFSEYLKSCRDGGTEAPPFNLLDDVLASEALQADVIVSRPSFEDRYAFGVWLLVALSPLDMTALSRDAGIWSWLGLFFFDQTCPA